MAPQFRERRFIWTAAYFIFVGILVMKVFEGLASVGTALSADPGPPPGIGKFILKVGPYCTIGAIAGCIRSVKTRAMLALVAQIVVILTIAVSSRVLVGGLVNGLIFCSVLLVPFGWVWFVLVMDLFPKSGG